MDNLITGTDDEMVAQHFYKEAKEIFKDANMNLRDWNQIPKHSTAYYLMKTKYKKKIPRYLE